MISTNRPAMENAALWNDAIVEMGRGSISQGDGTASQAIESILEEMEFEEIVEKNQRGEEEGEQVVRERDKVERVEEKGVGIGRWYGWSGINNAPIEGHGGAGEEDGDCETSCFRFN